MLASERLAVFVFFAVILSVYAAAGLMTARYVVQRFIRKAPTFSRTWTWAFRLVLGLALLGVLCAAYAFFVEPYWLAVTRVRIPTPKLPKGSRPIRIVHISDLHSDARPRLEERLPGVIAAQDPDLIVFTGDAANSDAGMPVARRCLSRIAQIAPTFAVMGNWDFPGIYDGTSVRLLHADALKTDVRGTTLWIAGVAFGAEVSFVGGAFAPRVLEPSRGTEPPPTLDAVPREALAVFLYHTPDLIYPIAERNIDLCLCGHTHGGQVALPLYGALVTLSRFGKRFEAGLYRVGDTWLYVNRGIGMMGGPVPRVRFWSRPEVTVIELVPAEDR